MNVGPLSNSVCRILFFTICLQVIPPPAPEVMPRMIVCALLLVVSGQLVTLLTFENPYFRIVIFIISAGLACGNLTWL